MISLDDRYQLSAYVCIRPRDGKFLVETALSDQQFMLSSPSVFRLLLAFAGPVRAADVIAGVAPAQREKVQGFIERCHSAQLLTRVREDGRTEEEHGSLASWEFHDLLFHARSRLGRHHNPFGGTFRFLGALSPLPALKPPGSGAVIPLDRPSTEHPASEGASLISILQARRSLYRTQPLDLGTLGTFLYHTACVTEVRDTGPKGQVAKRVYPSGGGIHPLEIYVTAARCKGLERGLYHYRPGDHVLETVSGLTADVEALLDAAQRSTGDSTLGEHPSVLITIAARFRRTAWKYQSIAYRLILLEVGALLQTMYLVATAMRLAPCAIGAGDSDRFAQAIGANYYEETSIGEFVLAGSAEMDSTEA